MTQNLYYSLPTFNHLNFLRTDRQPIILTTPVNFDLQLPLQKVHFYCHIPRQGTGCEVAQFGGEDAPNPVRLLCFFKRANLTRFDQYTMESGYEGVEVCY